MSTKIKLAYGNVYGGGILDYDYRHNIKARLPKIRDLVQQMHPAVFGMVESHQGNNADKKMASAVGSPYALTRAGVNAGNGYLYDKTVVKVVGTAGWRFKDHPSKSVTVARFQVIATKLKFVFALVHLEADLGHDYSGDRRNEIKFAIGKVKGWAGNDPVIWAGDFNEYGYSKGDAKRYLLDEGWVSIQKGAVNADRDSNNGKKDGHWIDDLFVKAPVTHSSAKLWPTGSIEGRPEHEQTGASDHWGWPMATVDFNDVVPGTPTTPGDPPPVVTPLPPAEPPPPKDPPVVIEPAVVQHRGPGAKAPQVNPMVGSTGRFRTFAKHPNGRTTEISTFRNVPTLVTSWSTADPFGDASAVLSLPQVSSFERTGEGDLWWLVPWFGLEVRYEELVDGVYVDTGWRWEGNAVSEEIGEDQSVQFKGALYMADNFEAAPFYPQYPVPYEQLIARCLDPRTHPSLPNKAVRVDFPASWNVTVPAATEPSYLWFLRPYGVTKGQKWSGLTTRATGGWEPSLTGFVQTLLSTMYTPEGDQWTLMKEKNRQPVLKVRNPQRVADETTLELYNGAPGVIVQVSRDFTQSANVIYGAGTDLAGSSFSGAQVTPDGETTFYEPFAALPQVYPAQASNHRLIPTMMRKESRISFPQGIDEDTARDISMTQIRRFADPGYVGSISLESDPFLNGRPFNRLLIQAGGTVLVHNLRGTDVLFHVTSVEVSPMDGTVSLSVDTKFRDALTVAEVKARTRDALDPVNLLQVGKQSVTVNDLLKPWSYSAGSGVIPSGSSLDATPLFKLMDVNATFPWTSWTKKYPPSKYPQYYIKVSKKGAKAADRWQDNGYTAASKSSKGVSIKASQAGNIRLSQIAAYDKDGNQVPVKFHFGIYTNSGITSNDMPMIPKGATGLPYAVADRYPFFPEAFEQIKPTGEEQDNANVLLPEGADMVIAWGNVHDPAGYSPGLFSAGGAKSGRLVDESPWSYDTSSVPGFDKYSTANNAKNKTAGLLYCMIFCDDSSSDLFFLGRLFVAPLGG